MLMVSPDPGRSAPSGAVAAGRPSDAAGTRPGPLAGVRVLDLSAVVLGPLATQWLGDLGADVIKVEPLEGDLMRANGISRRRGMSSIFLTLNRNKRSLAVDLKRPEGLAVIQRLLPTIDVLVHNMRSAAIERLGLGYAACAALNPKLVYCLATGFGEDGPDAGKPAFDDVIQAASGLAALLGHAGGEPDYIPSLIADKTTGLALANAVLAALFARERQGIGQCVEVPMFETMVAFTLAEHLGGRAFEPTEGPAGYPRLLAGGRKPAPTQDGHVALLPYTALHWRKFFTATGRADLAAKYGTDDRHARNAQVKQLYADMWSVTRTMTTAALLDLCRELDIPATRLWAIDELPDHPHLQAVQMFQPQQHPTVGPIVAVRPPVKFTQTPAALTRPAPELGQHGAELLAEAGYSADEIDALCAAGIVGLPTTHTTPTTETP